MSKPSKDKLSRESLMVALLILLNVGLVIVDRILLAFHHQDIRQFTVMM